jgi:hypothetical protein
MDLEQQNGIFLDGYCRHVAPLTEPDRIILRFARLLAMVIYVHDLGKADTWRRRARGSADDGTGDSLSAHATRRSKRSPWLVTTVAGCAL